MECDKVYHDPNFIFVGWYSVKAQEYKENILHVYIYI